MSDGPISGEIPIVNVKPVTSRWTRVAWAALAAAMLSLFVGIPAHDAARSRHDDTIETRCARRSAAAVQVALANVLATQSQILSAAVSGHRETFPELNRVFAVQALVAKDTAAAYAASVTRCQR